jgi:broad specificity phosphatase PhoE
MKIHLITHAHTQIDPNAASDTWQLSSRGLEQAERLSKAPFWDEVTQIVVSSEAKTWLTVSQVAADRSLPVWVDSRFDELRRSGWTENYADVVATAFATPNMPTAGWESVQNLQERVGAGLLALQNRFGGEMVALVGHGIAMSVLRAMMLGQERVDAAAWSRLAFGSYATVDLAPKRVIADFQFEERSTR